MSNIITVRKGEYLRDKIQKLPHGIIDKTDTGIGATTVELKSDRHSIIVEPLRITASAKAFEAKGTCYVGSPTSYHPDKSDNAVEKRIKAYLKDDSIKFKKFVVVADSLKKLVETLARLDTRQYFLMIDEADRTQMDVGFRSTMEELMRIYHKHDPQMRCMITATPVKTHDPALKDEPLHVFKREKSVSRNIKLISTTKSQGVLFDQILEKYNTTSDKIVIALNSVITSRAIAKELVAAGVPLSDIQIWCGENSHKKAGVFFQRLDETGLKTRITFKTAAYFNGFDIHERYHLISCIDPQKAALVLSSSVLKQIAGRCRDKDGLYSETVVFQYDASHSKEIDELTFENLMEAASKLLETLRCAESHFQHSSLLKSQVKAVFSAVDDKTKIYGYSLLKKSETGYDISYLSLDAILETNYILRNECKNVLTLKEKLSHLHNVSLAFDTSLKAIDSSEIVQELNKEERTEVEESLSYAILSNDTSILTDYALESKSHVFSHAMLLFQNFSLYVDKEQLKSLVLQTYKSKQPYKALQTLERQLVFATSHETSALQVRLRKVFPIGSKVDSKSLQEKMLSVIEPLDPKKAVFFKPRSLSLLFKAVVECEKDYTKGSAKKTQRNYIVKGYNPLNVAVKAFMHDFETQEEQRKRFSSILGFHT